MKTSGSFAGERARAAQARSHGRLQRPSPLVTDPERWYARVAELRERVGGQAALRAWFRSYPMRRTP